MSAINWLLEISSSMIETLSGIGSWLSEPFLGINALSNGQVLFGTGILAILGYIIAKWVVDFIN